MKYSANGNHTSIIQILFVFMYHLYQLAKTSCSKQVVTLSGIAISLKTLRMMASSTLFNVIIFAILLALKCGFTFAHGEEESEESEDRSMFLYKLIGDWYELQYENKMMEEKIEMLEGNLEAMGNTNKGKRLYLRTAFYNFNLVWRLACRTFSPRQWKITLK